MYKSTFLLTPALVARVVSFMCLPRYPKKEPSVPIGQVIWWITESVWIVKYKSEIFSLTGKILYTIDILIITYGHKTICLLEFYNNKFYQHLVHKQCIFFHSESYIQSCGMVCT
jgi:hypothetical protein